MTLGRVVGTILVLLVLYAIITAPVQAASTTSQGASKLAAAGHSITVFLSSLVTNIEVATTGSSSSGTASTVTPSGGVETGDGSTPTER